jgi:LytS/YehU family sensor histidine kinase
MAVGILGFGLSIPWLTGLYGPLRPDALRWWVGCVAFVALSAAIWGGNRWLLFKQRQYFDWFANPWRKLVLLVTANVLYTAPLTAAALWGWYRFSGQPVDAGTIQVVVLANVICVLFVTHAYETVFLIRERESDMTRVERLERLRSQAELEALKAQVDPHFLFNSLNTLGHLIVRDAARGREFCDLLAEVYRYVLATRERDLVPLGDELTFVRNYHRLLALRFGAAVQLELAAGLDQPQALVPPLSVQTLLENAVKHNRVGDGEPLRVLLSRGDGELRVSNTLLARSSARASSGLGLRNLDERCRHLTGRPLQVQAGPARFEVVLPLVEAA